MNNRTRIRALGALLGLWAVAAWGVFGFSDEPQHVPLVNVSGPASGPTGRTGARDSAAQRGLHVNLAQFEATRSQRQEGFSPPKNIFASPLGGIPVGTAQLTAGEESTDSGEPPPQLSPEARQSSGRSSWRYLGYVVMGAVRSDKPLAVLALNDDLHIAALGARLDEYLIVKAIQPDQVTLLEVPARTEHMLPLVDVVPTE